MVTGQLVAAVTLRSHGAVPGITPLDVARELGPGQVGEGAAIARHVAHRGHAAVQRVAEALGDGGAAVAVARVGGEVNVGIDQPGDDVAAGQVEQDGLGWRRRRRGRTHLGDGPVSEDDGLIGPRRGSGAVDDGDVGEGDDVASRGMGWGLGEGGERDEERESGRCDAADERPHDQGPGFVVGDAAGGLRTTYSLCTSPVGYCRVPT
jgi:hypothetical protein